MVERAIQTIKTLLKKAKATCQDPYIALLQLRNAPCADGPSPAQLIMGRRQGELPATDAYLKLKPKLADPKETKKMWVRRKEEEEKYYNK